MKRIYVNGFGVLGPGLTGREHACRTIRGDDAYAAAPTVLPQPKRLPAAEARRSGVPVRAALQAADEAFAQAGQDPRSVPTIFASSSGDGENVDAILRILAADRSEMSPTRFHNSVHNAPAGYWSIATGSHAPSTSLCGYDWSFAAGLLEVACQITVEADVVALVAYDCPYPEPLHSKRPVAGIFAVALVAAAAPGDRSMMALDVELLPDCEQAVSRMCDPSLEDLRRGIPAARALPLLAAIGGDSAQSLVFDYPAGARLAVNVIPCR